MRPQTFIDKTSTDGFPSHMVDPRVKEKKEWCMAAAKAMDHSSRYGLGGNLFKENYGKMDKWRKIMRGKQDPEQYKASFGIDNRKGKKPRTWRVADWSIFSVMPKFKEILISKIVNQSFNINVNGIDPQSVEERAMFRNKLKEKVVNQGFNEKMRQMGIGFDDDNDNIPAPENMESIEVHEKMFFNDEYSMEAKDALKDVYEKNSGKQIEYDVAENMVELGLAGKYTCIDNNGDIIERAIIPENCISNDVIQKDFSDLKWFGEYVTITIAELKVAWPDQPEEVYRKIAEKQTGRSFGHVPFSEVKRNYSYDAANIKVLYALFKSDDMWVHVIDDTEEGRKVVRKPFNFPTKYDTGEKIPDDQYYERFPTRKIKRTPVTNWYQCKWIKDTDYAYDFGPMKNMARVSTNISKVLSPVTVYTTNFDSIARMLEPIAHQMHINWLQFQNHVQRSKPDGHAIEMSALEKISLGKNKVKMQPKEILRMAFDTGVLLYRRKDWSGNQSWRPIEEFKGSEMAGAEKHLYFIKECINLLRDILGVNEIQDASTPNPKTLKSVAQMAAVGTENAINYLYHGFRSIKERSAKVVVTLLPDARRIAASKGYSYSLGKRSDEFWLNLGLREMGIVIEEGPDLERQQYIDSLVADSIKNRELTADDAMEIENEENLDRKAWIFRQRRKERMEEAQQSQKATYEMELQKNQASADATANAEIRKLQEEFKLKSELAQAESQLRRLEKNEELQGLILLEKLRSNKEIDKEEEKRITEYGKQRIIGEYDVKVAKERGSTANRNLIKK